MNTIVRDHEMAKSKPVAARWFENQVVLVTGAASGIGAAAAQRFAAEGAAVALVDIDRAGVERVAALIDRAGGKALPLEADIGNAQHNREMVGKAIARFGRVNAAFLNAGILGGMAGFGDLTLDVFDRVVLNNLYGCFHALKALQDTIESNGAIVVTASTAGLQGLHENAAYAASKHGIIGLVQSAAKFFSARGVRINAICPGGVATPMAGVPQSDALLPVSELRQPAYGGQSSAQQVAELALFLASSRASAITGAAYVIDAGWTACLPTGTG